MSTHRILSFDPGLSTGIALGEYSDEKPYTLISAYQIPNGLAGLLQWLHGPYGVLKDRYADILTIAEKFQPINHSDYALTTASVEPLRCEGALVALNVMPDFPNPRWRRPAEQYFVGGVDLADKKKRAYAFLKDNGMYVTGKTVGCPDADDARSAILHGIAYVMKSQKNRATFEMVNNWKGVNNGE